MNVSFAQRIALALPPWWGSLHPHVDSLIAGYAAGHMQVAAQIVALRPLMRLQTVTGELLDVAALDFFGASLARLAGEGDAALRARIQANLFRIQGTRPAFDAAIFAITGAHPIIIDPRQPSDTGVSGNVGTNQVPTLFYNSVRKDCYTNITMHHQWFVKLIATGGFTRAQLLQQVAAIIPAGTISWVSIAPDPYVIYYNGVPVTYMGQLVTIGV